MGAIPLILVVGGDALAVRVCEELLATQGHRVAVVWLHNDYDTLRLAGVADAESSTSTRSRRRSRSTGSCSSCRSQFKPVPPQNEEAIAVGTT